MRDTIGTTDYPSAMDGLGKVVAANILRLRKERGLSQAALARASGVHINTVKFIEGGQVENMRLDTVDAIATALGVDPAELTRLPHSSGSISPAVEAFRASPLYVRASPTDDEMAWLMREASHAEWLGDQPDALAIYYLLEARRAARHGT